MNPEMKALYQEMILDHYKKPRNFHALNNQTHEAKGHNPLCGDRVTVYLVLDGNTVKDIGFQGTGCAISTASASMMTDFIKGKTIDEIEHLFSAFHDLVTLEKPLANQDKLGKLKVFEGVREFPMRVKCATLSWHTLKAALNEKDQPTSTE
ncbi:MAG: SUF system NifU family Fe-S cluster assembly protein [Bdellovibrionales bacterium]|nr:SUF system NifU family Fe-S cluster assembly protein [Bdellovibrionales bacterium]